MYDYFPIVSEPHLSAFPFDALQLTPLLDGLRQIYLAQRYLHLPDLVVFGETIEVENGEYQRFVHSIGVRYVLNAKLGF